MNVLSPASHRAARHAWGIAFIVIVFAGALALARAGLSEDGAIISTLVVLERGLSVPLAAGAFLLAGWGFARPLNHFLFQHRPATGALQWALGLGIMLWLSHALGVLGLLSGPKGQYVAIVVLILGLGSALLSFMDHVREREAVPAISLGFLPGAIGACVLFLASLSPPGWLWLSEAGGYDTLSYHAQLPLEWARSAPHGPGRLWPLEHNVYSFLPSYMEGAFLFVHAALGGGSIAPLTPATSTTLGLLAGEGWGLAVCQMIHAGCALIAACLTASLVRHILSPDATSTSSEDSPLDPDAHEAQARRARFAGDIAAALVLCTPWVVVTGSMMYNEAAVLALFAGALVAALPTRSGSPDVPCTRALLVGLLMGCACACKPTAMFLCVPIAAMALLFSSSKRDMLRVAIVGTIGGLITFGPPLIRNWLASGNPVFPAGAGIFGLSHWSAEQFKQFASGHASPGFIEGLRLLISPATDASSLGAEARGVWHSQFAFLWPAALFASAIAIVRANASQRRAIGVGALGIVIAIVWWAGFSHAQSRFLVPLVGVLAAIVGVCVGVCLNARANTSQPPARLAYGATAMIFVVVAIVSGGLCVRTYLYAGARPGFSPNAALVSGVGVFTGEVARQQLSEAKDPREAAMVNDGLGPAQFVNLNLQPGDGVMLLSLATPLYWHWPTAYHTTWDARSMCDAIQARPDDPAMWTAALQRDAKAQIGRTVTHVLIDFNELARLQAAGWYDKRLTRGSLERWLQSETETVRVFTDSQGNAYATLVRLLNLPVSAPPATPQGSSSPAPRSPGSIASMTAGAP